MYFVLLTSELSAMSFICHWYTETAWATGYNHNWSPVILLICLQLLHYICSLKLLFSLPLNKILVALKYFRSFIGNVVQKLTCSIPFNSTDFKLDMKLRVFLSLPKVCFRQESLKSKRHTWLAYFPIFSYLTGVLDSWGMIHGEGKQVKDTEKFLFD